MRKLSLVLLALVVGWAMLYMGCMDREPAPVCPVPLEVADDDVMVGGFDGVDMLVVVDNSISMGEEQSILATSVFPLVNSLVNPLPDWIYAAANNVRIGIVSSDMGLSYGGQPYENGDGWPGGAPPDGCSSTGDNGQFYTSYTNGNHISVAQDFIRCGQSAAQCPTGWQCVDAVGSTTQVSDENTIGYCHDPSGDGTNLTCPASAADLGMLWVETTPTDPKPDLAFTAACMSNLGTGGCGFEQQLQSAAMGLTRSDQSEFVRENKLLVVLVVSDEEDCSMDDGPGLFASDEVADSAKWNIACGVESNQQYLFTSDYFFDTFKAAKGGEANSVVFAAIVGVPPGDPTCEGPGDSISTCLDHPDMQLTERTEVNSQGTTIYYWEYACERREVTKAYPGRRYVELAANEYGRMSYIYSICNDDWSPAMLEIAKLIASNLSGTCYEKSLDYDLSLRQAKCDVVVEYDDEDTCPPEFGDDSPESVEIQQGDVVKTVIYCTLPQLPAEQNCDAIGDTAALDLEFGWYYCENTTTENFNEACSDGIDNDGQNGIDCDDSACDDCPACGGPGGGECANTCKYKVAVTSVAENEVKGRSISVQCIQQYSFEDPNCQEDVYKTCNNKNDDDGNGVYDCDYVSVEEDEENAHNPDPNCCPIDKATCSPLPSVKDDICKDSDYPPAACYKKAEELGCTLVP